MHHILKTLVVGGELSFVVSRCLKTWRCCVAEVRWLGLPSWTSRAMRERDPSSPGKRNSCKATAANINKCDFLDSVWRLLSSIV